MRYVFNQSCVRQEVQNRLDGHTPNLTSFADSYLIQRDRPAGPLITFRQQFRQDSTKRLGSQSQIPRPKRGRTLLEAGQFSILVMNKPPARSVVHRLPDGCFAPAEPLYKFCKDLAR
jgi:hypothetical protein